MARRQTTLTRTPPYEVEQALTRLGTSLRTARLRRNLTLDEVALVIGSGKRAVARAEAGSPGTAAVVYVALLWAYDLVNQLEGVADPATDTEGLARMNARARARAGAKGRLDNDF